MCSLFSSSYKFFPLAGYCRFPYLSGRYKLFLLPTLNGSCVKVRIALLKSTKIYLLIVSLPQKKQRILAVSFVFYMNFQGLILVYRKLIYKKNKWASRKYTFIFAHIHLTQFILWYIMEKKENIF